MNAGYISAFAALAGSLIGGLTTFAAAWVTQRQQANVTLFGLDMTSTYRKPGRYLLMYEEFMHEELVWRHDEIPWNGTIVVVACGSEPLRWAFLPEDTNWLDVENALHRGYRSHETGRCQVTVTKDVQIIDHWQFTILPGALTHGDQTASNWLAHQPWERVRARERATGIYQHDASCTEPLQRRCGTAAEEKYWSTRSLHITGKENK